MDHTLLEPTNTSQWWAWMLVSCLESNEAFDLCSGWEGKVNTSTNIVILDKIIPRDLQHHRAHIRHICQVYNFLMHSEEGRTV